VVGRNSCQRRAEARNVDQRRWWGDPDAIEAEKRKRRGESFHQLAFSEALFQPAQRAASRQPFVDIALEDDHARALDGKRVQKPRNLKSTLRRPKSEVGNEDAHGFAAELEIGVDRAAGLAALHGQVKEFNVQTFKFREQDVPVFAVSSHQKSPRHGLKPATRGQIIHLMRLDPSIGFGVHLLQAGDIGAALLDDLADAAGIAASIEPDAFVNVVRQRREGRHGYGSRAAEDGFTVDRSGNSLLPS
jgi:hypothetical protein